MSQSRIAARDHPAGGRCAVAASVRFPVLDNAGLYTFGCDFRRAGRDLQARGFPQLGGTSGKGQRCRYLLPGELGRSLLKDRYLYEDTRLNLLPRWRGQVSAQLCLPAGAGAGVRGYAAGRAAAVASRPSAAAFDPALPGEQWVFALPIGHRPATAAVCAGATAGFVDAPCAGCTAPGIGDGRNRRDQRSCRKGGATVSWRRRCRVGATADDAGRGHTGRASQGPGKKGITGSFA